MSTDPGLSRLVVDTLQIRYHTVTEVGNLWYHQSTIQDLFPSKLDPVDKNDTC
jgi:hypothetical protein